MISANPILTTGSDSAAATPVIFRRAVQGDDPTIFTDIFQEEINIAIWQRELSTTLQSACKHFLKSNPTFETEIVVTPENALARISGLLGVGDQPELGVNIAGLVEMFCYLFELKQAGLRLTALGQVMCPKFHVDKVPCRLVTTYQGVATEWLPHHAVDRTKLGRGSNGLPDSQSGLYANKDDIQQLDSGDVALLKGENWDGNENAGLVHRSPTLPGGGLRLLLTLDFVD